MNRRRDASSWQAFHLAAALLAITFNFLQPLAHAASMRDGATGAPWKAFCNPGAATGDDGGSAPAASRPHECCLALVQAPALAAPGTAFIAVEPIASTTAPSLPTERPTAFGIRDGPARPRGPPHPV